LSTRTRTFSSHSAISVKSVLARIHRMKVNPCCPAYCCSLTVHEKRPPPRVDGGQSPNAFGVPFPGNYFSIEPRPKGNLYFIAHLAQRPYSAGRLKMSGDGDFLRCSSCGSRHMRPSKLRFSDIPHFLILRFPVRCVLCGERVHWRLVSVLRLRATRQRH
jgi:hypothetical protein